MTSGPAREIKVFIASPGDLSIERRAFKDTVDELNKGFGRGAKVIFVPLGWEDALATTGRRSQDVINKDVDACDAFVLVMWRRWGQKAPDAVKRGFTSYTEEEFYRALKRYETTKAPTIFVFFKHIDAGEMASPGPDLKKVLKFRKKLEKSRQVLWHGFKDDGDFKKEVDTHLVAFANGETECIAESIPESLLPDSAIAEMRKLREEARQAEARAEKAERKARGAAARVAAAERLAEATAARKSMVIAESAAQAALDGKIEEARQAFAKALDGTTNIHVLMLGSEFFFRIGELDEAERLQRRALSISGPDQQTVDTAAAYNVLGLIEQTRGNLEAAEAYHKKSLSIDEELGRQAGVADSYGNLGLIEYDRGNLDAAEVYHKKSLAIDEARRHRAGMASTYGNLGLIERDRGNLDAAEVYCKKSLAIEEKLGRQEGIASDYGNLGVIERRRKNLDVAEAYVKKSLAIEEKLGRQLGVANGYLNLGNIAKDRGNVEEARRLWTLSCGLYKKIGAKISFNDLQRRLDDLE